MTLDPRTPQMLQLQEPYRKPRPSIKRAVEWIAYNDEPRDRDVNTVSELLTVLVVADMFDVEPEVIAKKIVNLRKKGGI